MNSLFYLFAGGFCFTKSFGLFVYWKIGTCITKMVLKPRNEIYHIVIVFHLKLCGC